MPLPDHRLTPDERRRAIAAILARGVRRLLEGTAAVTEDDETPEDVPRPDAELPLSGSASSSCFPRGPTPSCEQG